MCAVKKSLWLIPLSLLLTLCVLIAYTQSSEKPVTVTTLITTAATTATTKSKVTTTTTAYQVNYNLNTATVQDLITIDGVGTVLAERILSLRAEQNGFSSRNELLAVEGVGEVLLARIMAQFYIPDEAPLTTTSPTLPIITATCTTTTATTASTEAVCFELNAVTAEELVTVPGITPELAEDIIEFRTAIGGFSHPYELCLVGSYSTDWWAKRIDRFYVEGCTDPIVSHTTTTTK